MCLISCRTSTIGLLPLIVTVVCVLQGLSGDSGFLAANLYARSIFGEDALANLSVEKPFNKPDAPVIGHIRIRAKSQVSADRRGGLGLERPRCGRSCGGSAVP